MKLHKKSEILEIPKSLEKNTYCDEPYFIERTEENGKVVWFGYHTNWKFENGKWYELVGSDFIECETPEYEKLYMNINKNIKSESKLPVFPNDRVLPENGDIVPPKRR